MRRVLSAAAVGLLAALSASTARAALPSLYVHYAPDCTFQLVDDGGGSVTTLAPGTYQVVIDTPYPYSTTPAACRFVQFDLTGPGVSVQTTLGDGGSEIEQYPVVLKPSSTYVAQDDGSPARTRRTFTTAATGSPAQVTTTTTTRTAPPVGGSTGGSSHGGTASPIGTKVQAAVARGTLVGTVAADGTITLTKDGKPVKILPAGRYTFSIRDRSHSNGFVVQAQRADPITVTAGPFVGARSKAVTLGRGQWLFYGSFVGKKTYFLVTE
jgi:hypothetical protein